MIGLPGIHAECKRVNALSTHKAMTQAVSDAKDGNIPLVFHRADNKPWLAIVRLDDLPALAHALARLLEDSR